MTTDVVASPGLRQPVLPARRPTWSWPHYLAILGVPILLWEAWTIVAWLADEPQTVSSARQAGSGNWYAARVYEGLAILLSIAVATYVVRGCRRQRRLLTFDAMFCMAGATVWWLDVFDNFFQPTILFSSNWTNIRNVCGHVPFVVNPDCGRSPDPVLFLGLVETFGTLAGAIAVSAVLRWMRSRWPGISLARQLGVILAIGLVLDLALELPIVALGLWTYTSPPAMSVPLGGGLRYPIHEALAATIWIGGLGLLRAHKDDKGRTLLERGLEHHKLRWQRAITLLALYGAFQWMTLVPGTLPVVLYGPYESAWPKLPNHLVNNVCDAPGVTGTRYGPCPGTPGYRMPGRHSLPGRSP